jgi:Derlin-2/3
MRPPRTYNDIHNTGNGVSDFFQGLPVVCRTLLVTYLATGLLLFLRVLPIRYLYHDWSLSLFSFPPFASPASFPGLHRLVTNFGIIGTPSINYLFNLVWLVQYGASYEKAAFLGDAAGAIWMAMLGMANVLAVDLLLPWVRAPFHGQGFIFMMIYLWSKSQGPEVTVNMFGVIKLKAAYLPFTLLLIDIIQGATPTHGVRGILAGHLYWFFREVIQSRFVIDVPAWLRRARWVEALSNLGAGTARVVSSNPTRVTMNDSRGAVRSPGASTQQASTSAGGTRFRAFSGKANKLT